MQEHVVHLLRIEGTADEDCQEFLKCLHDRIGQGALERVVSPGDMQPVPISGDFGIEGAHVRVDELATACRPDWETLYKLVR